ncbi:MAG: 2Fe-2S iron-sulfur cluster-binding protein [Phycisphaerales bacterium JB041]
MPTITINGVACEFTKGQMILQVAHANGIDIPSYCYHDGLSIVASCRICLGEAMAPNPRNEGKLEPYMGGKLFPTCQTAAVDGMVVNTDSPKSVANQKAVMEYLLINHPLDCPVCDQSGECLLQDYSFGYGRGESRFEEQKVKQPKKDVGANILLYSDRCILCTRCVRFTREVTGTNELYVDGRGNKSEIDVFPGEALDNPLSSNVIDLCPVGALLDKDFLFAQRVWFLRSTPSIDGITASGDNIWIEHNEGNVYRIKPRENMAINKWWITDEVRYGWKHVHAENRLRSPMRRKHGALIEDDYKRAYEDTIAGLKHAVAGGKRLALMVSPNLTCEEAYALGTLAKLIDPQAIFGVGPVPFVGEDQTFPPGTRRDEPKAFTMYAEKAPNARGVQRVLGAIGQMVLDADAFLSRVKEQDIGAIIATGNYREDWARPEVTGAIHRAPRASEGTGGGASGGRFVVLIDTHGTAMVDGANVVLPGATWAEKAGTFESARKMLQAFEQAIPVIELAKTEGQIALDLIAEFHGAPGLSDHRASVVIVDEQPGQVPQAVEVVAPRSRLFNAADMRAEMADRYPGLSAFITDVRMPQVETGKMEGVEMVEL